MKQAIMSMPNPLVEWTHRDKATQNPSFRLQGVGVTLCLFLTMFGCAPVAPTLTGRLFQLQNNTESGAGQIYVYRMLTPPTLRSPELLINRDKRLDLIAGGFVIIRASAGKMLIETKWSWDTGVEDKSVQLVVEPGQTHFVRCHTDMWGGVFNSRFQVIPREVALYEMEGLKELPGSPVEIGKSQPE